MQVFVLGTGDAIGLGRSRYCARFFAAPAESFENWNRYLEAWHRSIEQCVAAGGINIVIAGDTRSTGLLAILRSRLSAPIYPAPSYADFEVLHDKWNFYKLCKKLALPTPRSWLFRDRVKLSAAIASANLPEHLIAKPLRQSGGLGIVSFRRQDAEKYLPLLRYQPILVQEYIAGQSACLSIFVVKGETKIAVGYFRRGQDFVFETNEKFLTLGSHIAAHFGTDGLLNYDAQITPEGDVYLLECNPRVYLNMDYAAIAGMNFVQAGLRDWNGTIGAPLRVPDQSIRTPLGLVQDLLTRPWRITRPDLRMADFRLADPMPLMLEMNRLLLGRCTPKFRAFMLRAVRPLGPDAEKYVGL